MKKLLFFILSSLIITFYPFVLGQDINQVFAEFKGDGEIVYTMVDVCGEPYQADAHILTFTNGSVYVIDAGQRHKLTTYLKKNNINTIDEFFISHAHKDHYGGIIDVINSGIKIKTVYFNMPDKEACDREKPWGCDYDHINKTLQFIKEHGIPIQSLKIGDIFLPQNNTVLVVLAAFDGNNTPIGKTDINDTSVIMKLVYGNTSVLFTGDLNAPLSNFLAKYPYNLKSDILKVPHHGTEGVATNAFFDAVSPKLALVPSPKDLWLSDRSKRIRDYFSSKNIPVLVSGIDGDVTAVLYEERYEIVKKQQPSTQVSPHQPALPPTQPTVLTPIYR
jgi:competence protein ComEC